MLTLPSNMFYTVTLPATLWFFDKAKTDDRILFIDARNIFTQIDSAHREFSEEQIQNIAIISHLHKGRREKFVNSSTATSPRAWSGSIQSKARVEPISAQLLEVLDDDAGKKAVGELVKQWAGLNELQTRYEQYQFGLSGVLRGAAVVFFAYIGFDAVSTAAQEAKNPQRDMPIAILGSLLICTILYMAVAAVLTGLVPYPKLNVPDPMAVGIDVIGVPWLAILVKIGALTGLTSVILVFLYGQSRIFLTMAKDGLLPPVFHALHPRFRTPYLGQLLLGLVGRRRRWLGADRYPRRTRQHRHALRLHRRVCSGPLPPPGSSGIEAAFPLSVRAGGTDLRHPLLPVSDDRAATGHVGEVGHLVGHRSHHLFRLRPLAQHADDDAGDDVYLRARPAERFGPLFRNH